MKPTINKECKNCFHRVTEVTPGGKTISYCVKHDKKLKTTKGVICADYIGENAWKEDITYE